MSDKRWIAAITTEGCQVHEVEGMESVSHFYVDDAYYQKAAAALGWRHRLPKSALFLTRNEAVGDACTRMLQDIESLQQDIAKRQRTFWEMKALLE